MKVYRPLLVALTILVGVLMSFTLIGSWTEPQVQSQLNLYQSDLILHASEWDVLNQPIQGEVSLRKSFLGENPVQEAAKSYETVRTSTQKALTQAKVAQPSAIQNTPDPESSATSLGRSPQDSQKQLVDELDLRLGLLYARAGESDKALKTWKALSTNPTTQRSLETIVPTAQVLIGLWSDPPQLLPNADAVLGQNLKGWFRFQGLSKLYSLQQRPDAALTLTEAEQTTAQSAFLRLLMVGIMPILGSIIGVAILLIWGLRLFLKQQGNRPDLRSVDSVAEVAISPLASGLTDPAISPNGTPSTAEKSWQGSVLWPKETIWQVMVLWFTAFFTVSYILVPVVVALLGVKPAAADGRLQAYFALLSYGCLMVVGLGILQLSLRPYIPNVLRWLKFKWQSNGFTWGLGGYFVALPLVLIISLLNQKLLKEQGGGNPILEIILQGHDTFTIGLLWFLVAVCAPLFEETLFRGFFLTSLLRYIPAWQAIALSGVVFAIAHLNLGDLLPLSVLGMVLGVVYWRSRNLLASMLLHSLWNSGSFIGLLILGSSGN